MPQGYTLEKMANDYAAMIREFGEAHRRDRDVDRRVHRPTLRRRSPRPRPAPGHSLECPYAGQGAGCLQLQIGELGRQDQWVKANHALFSAVFARPGVKGYLYKPLVWLMARLMAMDSPRGPHRFWS